MPRAYEGSHPWITFKLDLSQAPAELWLLLGEARSKCEQLAGIPLRPQTAGEMHRVYLAKGVRATAAIEGNTLSEEQVEQLLRHELELPKSQQYLATEVQNIVDAVNVVGRQRLPAQGSARLSVANLCRYNAMLLNGLKVGPNVQPGKIRTFTVGVGYYRGASFEDCTYLLERTCAWLNEPRFEPDARLGLAAAVLRATIAHLYLAWIHPFGDGNGRTARLVEFEILVSAGVPSVAAHLLSNHYNETRQEYYRQLDQASLSGGNILPFLQYAAQGFVDQLRKQLATVRVEQLDVVWRNFVHEQFRDANANGARQRNLVLDLSRLKRAVPRGELTDVSARTAREYSRRTPKTLQRDLADLVARGLILETAEGYEANVSLIEAFIPSLVRHAGGQRREPRTPTR